MSNPFALEDDEPQVPSVSTAYLDALNPEQRAAVEATDGPVLVLAGAGTGKTRVLTSRLAHILSTRRAHPWQIMAVTFTNKAAREMRERVAQMVGGAVEGIWLGTFHALALRILRRYAEQVGLKSGFTILDTDDQVRLLKQVLETAGIDAKKHSAQNLSGIIQRWKDKGLPPERVGAESASDFADGRALELYRAYQERLAVLNAADFGDLLLHCLTLFERNPDILAEYQRQFHYLLVDEYQDTNVAQYLWLRLLAQKHRNICCVGDEDQSVYSWRGAEIGNILRFEHDFPGAQVVRLEHNYRSSPSILSAASGLIAHNAQRLGKTLRAGANAPKGEPVRILSVWDGEEEARVVAERIENLRRAGESLSEMAILVRAGFQTREFEERLMMIGVPYRVIGGLRFYERQEVRDAIAYFRLIVQPADGLAFERIVNLPKRGLGDATLQLVHRLARARNIPLPAAATELVATDELKPKARAALGAFLDDVSRWRQSLVSEPHAEVAAVVLRESGYLDMWRADKAPDAAGRVENLKELLSALEEFEDLPAFLDHVSLVMENDQASDGDKVSLMTLHGAKGLEFDTVFLPGWEEGLFPHQRALDEGGQQALEEERRLAYVGLTRARKRVFISFAGSRRIYNQWQNAMPSRFLDELPKEPVARVGAGGAYSGGFSEKATAWRGPKRTARDEDEDQWRETVPAEGYAPGERVLHSKFGYGQILRVDGGKLEIAFDKAGIKNVMDSFVVKA